MMERILIYNLSIKVLNYSDLYKTVQNFPLNSFLRQLSGAGTQKRADSYFPPEDRVRLVRLVSHGELPGERSGVSIVEYSWNNL